MRGLSSVVIYTRILNRRPAAVRSPADRFRNPKDNHGNPFKLIHRQEIDCGRLQPNMPASRFALPHNLFRNQDEVPLTSNPDGRIRPQRGVLDSSVY